MPSADPNERSLPGASLRQGGHSLDLIRDGQPRGGKRVGQYAPQNFPPKPSPLPNESQWSEQYVTLARARVETAKSSFAHLVGGPSQIEMESRSPGFSRRGTKFDFFCHAAEMSCLQCSSTEMSP